MYLLRFNSTLTLLVLFVAAQNACGLQNDTASTPHRRAKRYLDFLETSRMFYRINLKNLIKSNPSIFQYGIGFRANTPILTNKLTRPFKRDTYNLMEELIDRSGFDGRACVLKAFCTAHLEPDQGMAKGFLFKLLKFMFTLDDDDKRHMPHLRTENCQQLLHSHCPLSFNSISPYTDDI